MGEECVGHTYFVCVQNLTSTAGQTPTYRDSQTWFNFQTCSYGPCCQCDVFTQLMCFTPCTNYTTFTRPDKNDIMKDCSSKLGINWGNLQQCAQGEMGKQLLFASASVSRSQGATYGTKGLPVVYVRSSNGTSTVVRLL